LISLYCKVFNLVLDCGIIPESWSRGIIKPVYKNKGNPSDPDVSKAFLKSTKVQCNFLPKEKYKSIRACKMNILSTVE
jgi:hypothetical protein